MAPARQRGYDEATFVESFVILNAAGGGCLDDFGRLREDAGLSELIGHELPSPEAAWNFLHAFHEEKKIEDAQQRRLPGEMAYIPEESAPLAGLGWVNRELVQELGSRCADQQVATVDQDATIIESRKREALVTYEGERGYQPMPARRRRYNRKAHGTNSVQWLPQAAPLHPRPLYSLPRKGWRPMGQIIMRSQIRSFPALLSGGWNERGGQFLIKGEEIFHALAVIFKRLRAIAKVNHPIERGVGFHQHGRHGQWIV